LHMAQLMPLPLTVSCFSKIQIGFTSLVPAHLGSPGKRAVKRVCVCVCNYILSLLITNTSVTVTEFSSLVNFKDKIQNMSSFSNSCSLWPIQLPNRRQTTGERCKKRRMYTFLLHYFLNDD